MKAWESREESEGELDQQGRCFGRRDREERRGEAAKEKRREVKRGSRRKRKQRNRRKTSIVERQSTFLGDER